MDIMKVFIIEDNASHLKLLKIKVESLDHQIVGESQTVDQALSKIKKTEPELILVDINIEGDNEGIHLAKAIKEQTDAFVFFITSQSKGEVISEAVSTGPDAYLLKPVDPAELRANIELAIQKRAQLSTAKPSSEITVNEEFLSVRIGERLQLLQFSDIKLIKVETKNYVTLVDVNNKTFVIRDSLKNVMNNVLPKRFIRTHHSYGVNTNFILFIDERDQMLHLKTNDILPIGKSYKKDLYEKMNIKS